MDKGKFGKIRNAVKEYAEYSGERYRDVILFFKELQKFDANMLNDAIIGLSGIREVKSKIGNEQYDLFTSIAMEKEKEIHESEGGLSTVLIEAEQRGDYPRIFQEVVRSMDAVEGALRKDDRIQKAFAGQEAELNKLIDATKTWMKSFFASVYLHSVPKGNAH